MNFGADIKILIVGNTSTGKTSFVKRYTTGTFLESYKATIISEYKYKIIKINDKIYRIHLWDLGGQDKNIYISKLLLKDCNGIIIFSDINRKNTIDDMLNWKNFLKEYNNLTFFNEETPIIGIYNKCDLINNNNIEQENFVDNFIDKKYFDNNFKTSVKENINVEEPMNYIINKIIELLNKKNQFYENAARESILINKKNNNNINETDKKKEKCC
jgi:small GTP-binding protein